MITINFTKHAEQRMSQRGILRRDLEMILNIGEMISDEEILVRDQSIDFYRRELEYEIREKKKIIQKLNKIKCWKIVSHGKDIITTYCPSKVEKRRMRIRMRSDA